MCKSQGYNTLPEGMTAEEFASSVESSAVEDVLKNMIGDAFYKEKEDGTSGKVGVALANKSAGSFGSTQLWKIITEIENGETKATYGAGWHFVESGSTIEGIGTLKNSYIIDYTNRKAVKFNATKHTILYNGSNLAVSENLKINIDPSNMTDGSSSSWGEAILYGFSETEYNFDGSVKSGWTKSALIFDGVDDYVEFNVPNNTFNNNGFTFETYGNITNGLLILAKLYTNYPHYNQFVFHNSIKSTYTWNLGNHVCGFSGSCDSKSKWIRTQYTNNIGIDLGNSVDPTNEYVTVTMNPTTGLCSVYKNGKLVDYDILNKQYILDIASTLNDTNRYFNLGRSISDEFDENGNVIRTYYKFQNVQLYAARIYNKVLTDNEVLANYNATVSYHNILVNNGNASTGGNTGGEDIDTIE